MSEVKTFRAASMQEALDRVRDEMGSEAVILHTRQIAQRRFLPWSKRKSEVEITAGLGVNVRPTVAAVRAPAPRPAAPRAAIANELRKAAVHRQTVDGDEVALSSRGTRSATIATARTAPQVETNTRSLELANEFASKLDSIQKMLENLGRTTRAPRNDDVPSELFALYTELIDSEVEDAVARDFIRQLKDHCSPEQLRDTASARVLLRGLIEAELTCRGPIQLTKGRRKLVALVGSTGVGKTTTVAKLAANFRLRDGIKMGLVTVDTYRIAAVEQLRTYAEIIDLPMKVVTSPGEMRRALDELVGLDLVLVDTAGRSPRDEVQIQELKSLLAEANVDECHLVLNANGSLRSLEATAEKFAAAGTTSLIMTKLDEAAGFGPLLSLARKVHLPISYLTTGQDVPDDIEPATSARIARLVMGEDRLGM